MSAREEILAGRYKDSTAGDAALRAAGKTGALAELFAGFVGYANANWSYSAQSGGQKAQDLLDGEGLKNVACGTLREALKIMVREDLKLEAKNADINDKFITKPRLQCFDPKVKGNVRNFGGPNFEVSTHFSAHYFLETGGKFYDPCLMSVYSQDREPVEQVTKLVMKTSLRKAGTGRAIVIFRRVPGASVPGFGECWEILLPAEWKRALTADEVTALKTDPDVVAAKLL
jgi:hypothetical protein